MAEILKVESIGKKFNGFEALSDVSFSILEGEIIGLLGPNGAGKSTLMKIILQAIPPSSGRVFFNGKNIRENQQLAKQGIAMVPQDFAFFEELSIKENLFFFAAQLGIKKQFEKCMETAQSLGLEHFLDKPSQQLSGGYKRLLNLAIALLQEPKILFLDEPSVGLDPINRSQLWEKIRAIQKKGTTICISTHYMEEAKALCNRVCMLHDGKIVALDSPQKLIQQYAGEHITTITLSNQPDQSVLDAISKAIPKEEVMVRGTILVLVTSKKRAEKLELIRMILKMKNLEILKIWSKEPDLEQAFINLTGKELKEN
jgi:ABC-2 type transport system ATP-binding protein